MSRSLGVTEWLRSSTPEPVVDLFALLTVLGDWRLLVVVLGLAYLGDVFASLRRPDEGPADPLCSDRTMLAIATVFGAILLTLFLKELLGVPRPPADLQATPTSDTDGFPSGHALIGTVFWVAVARWFQRGTTRTRYAVTALIIVLVALSRLVVGAHFLVDVLVGVGIGVAYVGVVIALGERPMRAFGIAFVLGILAVAVTAGGPRAIVGLLGAVVAAVGWRVVELPNVRAGIVAAAVTVGLRPAEPDLDPERND